MGDSHDMTRDLIIELREQRIAMTEIKSALKSATEDARDAKKERAANAAAIAEMRTALAVTEAKAIAAAAAREKAQASTDTSFSRWLTIIGMVAGWGIAGVAALYQVLRGD